MICKSLFTTFSVHKAFSKWLNQLFTHLTILSGMHLLNGNEETPNPHVLPADSNLLLRSHRYCHLLWLNVWLLPLIPQQLLLTNLKPSSMLSKVNCHGTVFIHLCPVFTLQFIHATFSPRLSASWRLIGPLNSCALAAWLKQLDTM